MASLKHHAIVSVAGLWCACACFLFFALTASAADVENGFSTWLQSFKQEARAQGVSQSTLNAALDHVQLIPRVIELEQSQPEFIQTFLGYLQRRVTPRIVAMGEEALSEHRALFGDVEQRYEVPRAVLVALWGMETNFGNNLGEVDTLSALSTLAYEGRRPDFFRGQLLAAMKVIEQDHVDPQDMRGSWAGAFGHMQFIPTTFLSYAADGDADGTINLRESLPDAMFSAANYLKQAGWRLGEPIAIEVRLPDGFDFEAAQLKHRLPVSDWAEAGVTPVESDRLPVVSGRAAILLPQGWRGPAFMVFDNFDVIMHWNRSVSYALSVAHLARRLQGGQPLANLQTAKDEAISVRQVLMLQQKLAGIGLDVGGIDGLVGSQTQAAIRAYQKEQGLPVDGYAGPALFDYLLGP